MSFECRSFSNKAAQKKLQTKPYIQFFSRNITIMGIDWAKIILEYICPTIGTITATFMWLAPLSDLRKAIQMDKKLGVLNPLPWAFMMGTCTGFIIYSILIDNLVSVETVTLGTLE
jgi:uncharacterized protein with PQ loop repeat